MDMKLTDWVVTFWVPLLMALLVFSSAYYFDVNLTIDIVDFYQKNLRSSLFAGFLTMGGFLLSLKTGILIKIKENLYDNDAYVNKLKEQRIVSPTLSHYGPLKRLSQVLSIAVFACLSTSALQFTLGLVSSWLAVGLCLAFSAFAMSSLLLSFILMQQNLSDWFDFIEKNSDKSHKK